MFRFYKLTKEKLREAEQLIVRGKEGCIITFKDLNTHSVKYLKIKNQ